MLETATYAEVILPLPLDGTFTYSVPSELIEQCSIGKRTIIQFGKKRLYTGIIYSIHNNKPENFEVKPLIGILDAEPIVNKFQIRLWEWGADYYMCSIGEFYKASVPTALRLESETKILPVLEFDNFNDFSLLEKQIYLLLKENESLTINELSKALKTANPLNLVRNLMNKGALLIQEEVKQGYKPKFEKVIEPAFEISTNKIIEIEQELSRAKKQLELFNFYLAHYGANENPSITKSELVEKSGLNATHIKALVTKGIFKEKNFEKSRLTQAKKIESRPKNELNQHQEIAFNEIKEGFKNNDAVLLHGVTSSGKTEVYIHLIDEALQEGKQVLYMLPEIALTSQIIDRLKAVFGEKIGVYHSKFSGNERVEIWKNLLSADSNSYQIIIGVRSSILLPFSNLGLIIVDEEHENTYKQFDPAPRYNARDLAIVLAKLHKGKVLLGTATPSIESYYNAKIGRYHLVELFKRHKEINLPKVILADVRKAYKKKQMQAHFTPELISNIEEALTNNEQVILFQNRRGFSPYLECGSCGWIPSCKFCDVSLTYHKKINKLICHYCGYSVNGVYRCGHCKQPNLETKGFGTEKIEDEISLIFPNAKVARLDLDSTRGKHGHEHIITDFQNHKIDILIGTQMVSKGLDFAGVSLVGILNADNMLRYPDFRAYERSFQLMAQVSGRAGRSSKQGKVVIQTSDTEHKIIRQVINNNYLKMFMDQASERKSFFYPPFTRLIRLTLKHKNQQTAFNAASTLIKNLTKIHGIKVLGPSTPVINRIQNLYIQQIVIKLAKTDKLTFAKNNIKKWCNQLVEQKEFKQVVVIKDVDPA